MGADVVSQGHRSPTTASRSGSVRLAKLASWDGSGGGPLMKGILKHFRPIFTRIKGFPAGARKTPRAEGVRGDTKPVRTNDKLLSFTKRPYTPKVGS